MARAKIMINGLDATAATVAIGASVLLSNDDEGGELTYAWSFIDQPEGSIDALSNAAIENPSFTPTKEGTYELRLVVNANLGSQAIQTATVSVLDGRTGQRIPAAGETVEGGLRGWAEAVNRILAATLHDSADGNVQVAQTPGGIAVGTIVYFTGLATINPTMQFPFEVMQIAAASIAPQPFRLGVVLDGVIAGNLGAGKLVKVRTFGIVPFAASGSPAVGDDVYLGNTGLPQLTPGTSGRTVGKVLSASGGSYRWLFASTLVGTSGISDAAVTTAKLADGSVTSAKIADGAIVTADLADGAVTSAKIADGTIVAGDIADGTITTAKLATSAQSGRFLGKQVLTGTNTGTLVAGTCVVKLKGVGQGGGGGGGGNSGSSGAGAGGSSGVYGEITIGTPGVPLGTLAISWAAGSAAGVGGNTTGTNGTAGSDSTITINSVTYTFKGGGFGKSMGSPGTTFGNTVGSTAPAAGTTAALRAHWGNGQAGFIMPGDATAWAGAGGSTPLGAGGAGRDSGGAGIPGDTTWGFGGGGGGGLGNSGGAGAPGGFEIEQFT